MKNTKVLNDYANLSLIMYVTHSLSSHFFIIDIEMRFKNAFQQCIIHQLYVLVKERVES